MLQPTHLFVKKTTSFLTNTVSTNVSVQKETENDPNAAVTSSGLWRHEEQVSNTIRNNNKQ